ncbi:MAG: hypothetical protein ACE14W_03505 [Candidatus Velamenicoccus archaeovorus]
MRMYQVGFGDCFLLSFEYASALEDGRSERHILIDFGSTRRPEEGGDPEEIASLIAEHTHGALDVIVVTHRHKDHLSAFGSATPSAAIDALHPKLVVRSWTEDPSAAPEATGPTSLGERSHAFVRTLRRAQGVAASLHEAIGKGRRGLAGQLGALAFDQLGNEDAVRRLDAWAATGAGSYVSFGSDSGIGGFVPGITVNVLGPPTLEQHPDIARQRSEDPEYWMFFQGMLDEVALAPLLERHAEGTPTVGSEPGEIGPVRWLTERLGRQQLSSYLQIVRILDDVLNNTSVILLIRAGSKAMLFPGDAQIENWEYALKVAPSCPEILHLLRETDLYKVGHHGSRNATPRTLFGLWTEDATRDRPMTAMMSTLSGVHGESEATRVPRATLVEALSERMTLHSTEDLPPERAFTEVTTDLSNDGEFQPVD